MRAELSDRDRDDACSLRVKPGTPTHAKNRKCLPKQDQTMRMKIPELKSITTCSSRWQYSYIQQRPSYECRKADRQSDYALHSSATWSNAVRTTTNESLMRHLSPIT